MVRSFDVVARAFSAGLNYKQFIGDPTTNVYINLVLSKSHNFYK